MTIKNLSIKVANFSIGLLRNRIVFLILTFFIIGFILSLMSPYFLTLDNILGMTRFGAVVALLGFAQSLIMIGGEGGIDLSVGSIVTLSGIVIGILFSWGLNPWIAALLGILAGGLMGAVNGVSIAYIGIQPLIATLGTLYAYGSLALVITQGLPYSGFPESFGFIGSGLIWKIPAQILLIVIPIGIILQYLLNHSTAGRTLFLVGGNSEAAQLSGLSVKKVRFLLYTISGILGGLGGFILTSWFLSARPEAGKGLEMQAITVAVLGGVSIQGGKGSVIGPLLATLIVTMVVSGLQLAGVNTIWQLAILGLILLLTVGINQLIERK